MKRETITGADGSPYMTRYILGRLRLHVFHRGDEDPNPHTHPWDFKTFPLRSYVEEYLATVPEGPARWYKNERYEPGDRYLSVRTVRAWRWHDRSADHAHRILYPEYGTDGALVHWRYSTREAAAKYAKWPVVTIVWTGAKAAEWGFWRPHPIRGHWVFVPAATYLDGRGPPL